MGKERRRISKEFKAQVAIEALKEEKTLGQLSTEYGVHSNQISLWEKELTGKASEIFDAKNKEIDLSFIEDIKAPLYEEIGRLKIGNNFLKKVNFLSIIKKLAMIERNSEIKISRQCELLGLPRSSQYSLFSDISKIHSEDEDVMKKIDKNYTDCPFYGSRRIKAALLRYHSLIVNRKKIQRLMKIMGIYGQSPGIMTSRRCQKNKKYPIFLP